MPDVSDVGADDAICQALSRLLTPQKGSEESELEYWRFADLFFGLHATPLRLGALLHALDSFDEKQLGRPLVRFLVDWLGSRTNDFEEKFEHPPAPVKRSRFYNETKLRAIEDMKPEKPERVKPAKDSDDSEEEHEEKSEAEIKDSPDDAKFEVEVDADSFEASCHVGVDSLPPLTSTPPRVGLSVKYRQLLWEETYDVGPCGICSYEEIKGRTMSERTKVVFARLVNECVKNPFDLDVATSGFDVGSSTLRGAVTMRMGVETFNHASCQCELYFAIEDLRAAVVYSQPVLLRAEFAVQLATHAITITHTPSVVL
jgi:hypothetical protein